MAADAVAAIDDGWRRVLSSNDPDGAHSLRIGLRRLRVVLHIFRHAIPDSDLAALPETLAATARVAAPLRDLDVLIDDIIAPLLAAGPVTGASALIAMLETERSAARAEVRAKLRSADAQALRRTLSRLPDQLASLAASGGFDQRSMKKLARRDLKKRWRKIAKPAAALDTLSVSGLHGMRKDLKNLRYACQSFAPHLPSKTGAGFERRLKRLQHAFGYLNDVVVARQLAARFGASANPTEVPHALGYVLGCHTERSRRVRDKLVKQWRGLAGTKLAAKLAT